MITDKISALKAMKVKLNDPSTYFNWQDVDSCNCGILAQTIMDMNSSTLKRLRYSEGQAGSWSNQLDPLINTVCSVTGLPLTTVFNEMKKCGFDSNDIRSLENLNDSQISERAGIDTEYFNYREVKQNVIAYITAWISILEEEQVTSKQVEPEKVYVTVKVDSKVKELVSEVMDKESVLS